MPVIDIFTLFVMLILVATAVGLVVFLGMWPGKIARQRNHPQADAITVGSWVGLIAGGVMWPLVFIWAHLKPLSQASEGESTDGDLVARLEALEEKVVSLESLQGDKGGAA